MLTTETVNQIFSDFKKLNVIIIGDVMVDSYLWGSVERISPEAPVPIVSVESRENRLGGAANVGLNVNALGANAILCAVTGDDVKGNELIELMQNAKLTTEGIVRSKARVTTTKFRVFGNHTQMIRVDEENTENLNNEEFELLFNKINEILSNKNIDVVIFQDYDKGVISPELISKVVAICTKLNIPVVVDPKKKNFLYYKNVTLFKPNLKEIKDGLNINFNADIPSELENAIDKLQEIIQAKIILNTLSEKGVYIRYGKESKIIPAHLRNISDVSGAGDTVISVAALCLALQIEAPVIAAISNLAGGIVCEEVGVVPINSQRLQSEVIKLLI
jgi:D-glycero-beta-D-manno-heptose-7-phosphate kinase